MSKAVAVQKNESDELPIPNIWRKTFFDIVETIKDGDYKFQNLTDVVHPLSESEAKRIAGNIVDYGDQLISLPVEAWQTSIYHWMGNYWEVLIDLYTVNEGESDLVLFAHVYERRASYCFEIESVHVP